MIELKMWKDARLPVPKWFVPADDEVRRDLRRWVPEYLPATGTTVRTVTPATRVS
jgi:hypothetical protein